MSRWRALLQPERSTDRHRELARPLQHQAAALCTWLSTTRTTGDQTTARPDAHHELTSHSAWYTISVRPGVMRMFCWIDPQRTWLQQFTVLLQLFALAGSDSAADDRDDLGIRVSVRRHLEVSR